MKGTILDFLKLATEKPELAKELIELAARHEFEFVDDTELKDEDLDEVAGGIIDTNTLRRGIIDTNTRRGIIDTNTRRGIIDTNT